MVANAIYPSPTFFRSRRLQIFVPFRQFTTPTSRRGPPSTFGWLACLSSTSAPGLTPHAASTRLVRHASTAFRMPAMSPTMTSGTISRWNKQPGEAFEAGEVLLEIETDKASIEVEAQDAGVMGKVLVSAKASERGPDTARG